MSPRKLKVETKQHFQYSQWRGIKRLSSSSSLRLDVRHPHGERDQKLLSLVATTTTMTGRPSLSRTIKIEQQQPVISDNTNKLKKVKAQSRGRKDIVIFSFPRFFPDVISLATTKMLSSVQGAA